PGVQGRPAIQNKNFTLELSNPPYHSTNDFAGVGTLAAGEKTLPGLAACLVGRVPAIPGRGGVKLDRDQLMPTGCKVLPGSFDGCHLVWRTMLRQVDHPHAGSPRRKLLLA